MARVATRAFAARFASNSAKPSSRPKSSSADTGAGAAALGAALLGASAATAVALLEESADRKYQTLPAQKYPSPEEPPIHGSASHQADYNDPPERPDLPTISLEDLAEHCEESSLWYSFRGAVYDLTFFINGHPGGTPRLLMAAGQDLEPYWGVYRQHFRGHIVNWMERYRIGNLSPEDAKKSRDFTFGDMYETDPLRDANLLGCTEKPWCGEPRLDLLTKDYITPNELFYVRNRKFLYAYVVKLYFLHTIFSLFSFVCNISNSILHAHTYAYSDRPRSTRS